MNISSHFNLKTSFPIIILLSLVLQGCECISVGSRDVSEKKPWSYDESSVAGASIDHKSYKNITPYVGWNVPLDEPSNLENSLGRNNAPKEIRPEVKTIMNKKTKSIKVISSKK